MEILVLNSDSKANLKLIADYAKKIGVRTRYLSEEEKEDIGLMYAIKKERTGKYVDTEVFLKELQT